MRLLFVGWLLLSLWSLGIPARRDGGGLGRASDKSGDLSGVDPAGGCYFLSIITIGALYLFIDHLFCGPTERRGMLDRFSELHSSQITWSPIALPRFLLQMVQMGASYSSDRLSFLGNVILKW